jgi:hypothetical protein
MGCCAIVDNAMRRDEGMATGRSWGGVSLRDPRIPFACLLTLYGALGFTFLGFNRTPVQMALIVGVGSALDFLLHRAVKGRWTVPLSGYITACSLALLLNYAHASPVLLYPVLLAIGSKYALTFEGRHVFNPSMFGVAVALLTSQELITAAPAYQWAGGAFTMSAFIIMAALVLFVFRVGRTPLVVSFLVFYALQTALRAYILRHHLPPETLFLGSISAPAFFIFTFYMITDPATSPARPRDQVLLAFALVVVDLWLHTKESVYTFFYASLIIASGRFLFLHARAAWRSGAGAWLRTRLSGAVLARAGAVAALGLTVAVAQAGVFGAPADRVALGFRFEKVAAAHSGLHSEMGDVLLQVDERILHVAKWVLSVGDGLAVGDYDGDGLPDLFLSHPLKDAPYRAALYRNLGELRFEKVEVPALLGLVHRYRDEGLASGGVFVDYDGDGDVDLLVTVAFGHPRLLKNLRVETGEARFEDVSEQAGLTEHTVALTASFLDFDRDGRLDLFIPNAMPAFFLEYPEPRPFNAFRLPAPEFPGDRRMFRFMHDGWHNARNGGQNLLYRQVEGGRFEKLDATAMGMPQTHWSLAVGTGDFNRDGFTDLYVASDFGPDDLYLNEGGRRFVRVSGPRFGDIGKDTYKGMNVSVADFDRNGWLDVYVSNVHHSLQAEGSLLWMVRPGKTTFLPDIRDEATQRGALNERRFGWGAAAGDLDNDGWPDIVQANGMLDDRLDPLYSERKDYWYVNHKLMQSGPEIHTYADRWGDIRGRTIYPNEARRAYLNLGPRGPGQFVDVAARLGVADPDNSRGVLLSDLDRDGDLDLLLTNQHGPVSLYRSTLRGERPHSARFVSVALVGNGETTHRAALGTRVEVEGLAQEAASMGGFSAQADARLHFGLGAREGPVPVTVHWYGGETQTLTLDVDRHHVLHQPPPRRAERP